MYLIRDKFAGLGVGSVGVQFITNIRDEPECK